MTKIYSREERYNYFAVARQGLCLKTIRKRTEEVGFDGDIADGGNEWNGRWQDRLFYRLNFSTLA